MRVQFGDKIRIAMSIALKIRELLQNERINYQVLEHDLAYTAAEIAEAMHLPGHQMVKSVVVNGDGKWMLCVLSATHKIDFAKLKQAFSFEEVSLANEGKVASLFPGCDVGAMPPFGQLAGIPVYVDINLKENETIAFNAGTHTDMLKIKFKDFLLVAKPTFADFSVHV